MFGYITGLRKRGSLEVSHLEGDIISDKDWKKLTFEGRVYRNKLIERRSLVSTIIKTLRGRGIPEWIQTKGVPGASHHA